MSRHRKIRRIEASIWGIAFVAMVMAVPFNGRIAIASEDTSVPTTVAPEESTTTSTVEPTTTTAETTTTSTSTTTTTIPAGPTPIPNAGFEDNSFTGWSRGSQTGNLGASINGNGTGVTIFTGSRTFTHGPNGAMGSPTLPNGSPNPYHAPAVAAGSWTFSPNNATYAVALQPKGEQNFSQAMTALGLSGSAETALRGTLSSQAQASKFGAGNPTDAAWITREVQLTAGVTYTMNWNYLGTDYVPFNDGSITSLVAVSTPSSPTITVNNSVGVYALLGFTNPGTGDYSTNSYGATGWQMSTYQVSVTGTYKLGFAVFNLDDQALSPVLMVDNATGGTQRCVPAGSNCNSFGGVVSNNPTAPTVVPATTTPTTVAPTTVPATTVPPTTTTTVPAFFNAVQNLTGTVNNDGSVALDWDAPNASNLQPHMYDVSWTDLVDGQESGGWGVWTYATNTAYEIGSFQFSNTTGYGPVRIKVRAGSAACVGEGAGSCVYGPYSTVDVVIPNPAAATTVPPAPPVGPLQPLLPEPETETEPELVQDEPETPSNMAPEPDEQDGPATTIADAVEEETEEQTPAPVEQEEQQDDVLDEIGELEDASPAAIVQLLNELDSLFDGDTLTQQDAAVIAEAVDSILEQGIDEDVATELASSEVVLASVSQEQAAEIFDAIDESALTTEQAAAIIDAVQEAPSEVRQAFEAVVAIFGGAFDSYTMLNQNITVGQRRTVIAANLLVSAAAASALLAGSRPAPTPAPTTHRQEMAARREDEEEASGEISGDGVEWIRQIRIFKYVDGVRVMDWKAFIKKFAYGIMNMGFTLAGSLVVYLTLSGPIQKIAGISTVLAIAAAMWLHMKEPDES